MPFRPQFTPQKTALGMWVSQKPREQAQADQTFTSHHSSQVDKDGCRGAENKSRADAQQPDKQRGQEGTDKGFHYLKGRKRDTWRTSRNTNHREKIHTSTQMHCKPKGGGLKLLRSKKHLTQEFLERTQKKTNR